MVGLAVLMSPTDWWRARSSAWRYDTVEHSIASAPGLAVEAAVGWYGEHRFDISGDAGEMGEDSVGCYCSDGSACVSWAAVSTEEVNPDCFPYDDADDCEEGDWVE